MQWRTCRYTRARAHTDPGWYMVNINVRTLVIGASLSEPPPGRVNGCSFYMSIYIIIWYVRTSFRIPARFYFYAKSLKLCNYAIQPGRPGNEAKYAIRQVWQTLGTRLGRLLTCQRRLNKTGKEDCSAHGTAIGRDNRLELPLR